MPFNAHSQSSAMKKIKVNNNYDVEQQLGLQHDGKSTFLILSFSFFPTHLFMV